MNPGGLMVVIFWSEVFTIQCETLKGWSINDMVRVSLSGPYLGATKSIFLTRKSDTPKSHYVPVMLDHMTCISIGHNPI